MRRTLHRKTVARDSQMETSPVHPCLKVRPSNAGTGCRRLGTTEIARIAESTPAPPSAGREAGVFRRLSYASI